MIDARALPDRVVDWGRELHRELIQVLALDPVSVQDQCPVQEAENS